MKKIVSFIASHKTLCLLVLIILLGAILRLFNVPGRYTFDGDATPDAVVAYVSARDFQLPLTGNFSAAGAFTFGPWYYYHLILFDMVTRLPYSVWLFNGLLSLATVPLLFLLGKMVKDEKLGLILAFLGAITSGQIAIASSSSNPNIIVFYGTLMLILLLKIMREKSAWWWSFLMGFVIGIAINAHYQALQLLFFPFALLFVARVRKVQNFFLSIAGIIIAFIPLLFFNLTNHWHTLRNFIYYSLHGKGLIYVPNSWTIYLRDFWPQVGIEFFGMPLLPVLLLSGVIVITLSYLVWTRKVPQIILLSLVFMGISFLYLRYYWGERHTVYLYYLHPFFYLLTGYTVWFLSSRKRGWILLATLLAILSFFALRQDMNYMQNKSYAAYSQEARSIKRLFPQQSVAVYLCNEIYYNRAMAINYLLAREGLSHKNSQIKLAIASGDCPLPKLSTVHPGLVPEEVQLAQIYAITEPFKGYNFSTASESAIQKAGWKPILTDDVYQGEVRWYFTEQP